VHISTVMATDPPPYEHPPPWVPLQMVRNFQIRLESLFNPPSLSARISVTLCCIETGTTVIKEIQNCGLLDFAITVSSHRSYTRHRQISEE